MRVLIVVPRAEFNYKAPFMPLGMYSVATYLHEHGHNVKIVDRTFEKTKFTKILDSFHPEAVCCSIISQRVVRDALKISAEIKKRDIPVVWGAAFASEYYTQCLKSGCVDYITIGEGEINTLNLINAIENGTAIKDVKGIAYLADGEPCKTERQPIVDLAELPIIDFSLYDPKKYLHRYIHCKKMTYLYTGKGCPGQCTFCANRTLNEHCYRARPVEYVISEIKYLHDKCGLDGVYFSDDCWYIDKSNMYALCEALVREKLEIKWGCEVRIGIFNEDDIRYMYDHGCRWMFFGVESGNPEILKKMKKGIHYDTTEKTIAACKKAGITSIASFIIGYPGETPEQVMDTVNFTRKLNADINSYCIFTPEPYTEICDELVAQNKYEIPKTLEQLESFLVAEHSSYKNENLPIEELETIRAVFLWEGFTKKDTSEELKPFEVAFNSVMDAYENLTRRGISGIIPGIYLIAKEFLHVFRYSHFYPSIKRKYHL